MQRYFLSFLFVVGLAANVFANRSRSESEYAPLLETGKEWRYKLVGFGDGESIVSEWSLKLLAPEEVEGTLYFPLVRVSKNGEVFPWGVKLREDATNRQVWCLYDDGVNPEDMEESYAILFNPELQGLYPQITESPVMSDQNEFLLYDFKYYLNGAVALGWQKAV